jgi:hypothetical protein
MQEGVALPIPTQRCPAGQQVSPHTTRVVFGSDVVGQHDPVAGMQVALGGQQTSWEPDPQKLPPMQHFPVMLSHSSSLLSSQHRTPAAGAPPHGLNPVPQHAPDCWLRHESPLSQQRAPHGKGQQDEEPTTATSQVISAAAHAPVAAARQSP